MGKFRRMHFPFKLCVPCTFESHNHFVGISLSQVEVGPEVSYYSHLSSDLSQQIGQWKVIAESLLLEQRKRELYDFTFEPDGLDYLYFLDITCKFFGATPRELRSEPKHFIDFLQACYLPLSPQPELVGPDKQPFCFSVSYLHKVGVKIMPATKEWTLLDITFHEQVLRILRIELQDSTESVWRNLLIFEQCHYYVDSYIIDYLILLDLLIDDPKDVEILIYKGILTNGLEDNENVSNLFGNLTKQPNDYYNSTWHKNKAILRQKYFNHPWAVLSFISTIVLLLLTVIQAITSLISVIHM
ncbi:hypothetical protein Ancab_000863 [Ancistrocladus abbreviatus]